MRSRYKAFKSTNSVRSNLPLSNDQIAAVAPSIMAAEAHSGRSDRYTYIPTIDVLNALRKEGFQPFMVCQSKPRDEDRMGFARHMLRLRHASQVAQQEANEIILLNSHDGSSSYQMLAGVFRFVCENGMVAGDVVEDLRVRHTGNVIDNVIEGSYRILNEFEKVDESRDEMKSLILTDHEQLAFARSAMALKYDVPAEAPIEAHQLLRVQRNADRGDDLWSTFNRVQEHLIRGGVPGRTAKNTRTRTRAVNGISENVKLNRAIWTLADAMRSLKEEMSHAA